MTASLDCFGGATFRMKTEGSVLFLDAYIDRVLGADVKLSYTENQQIFGQQK